MASFRVPGPTGSSPFGVGAIDNGTMCRNRSPRPGLVRGDGLAELPLLDRFTRVMYGTAPYLPDEMREEFAQILSPTTLGIAAGTLAVWAGSHYVGVGFAVDAVLLTTGLVFVGWQVWSIGEDLARAIDLTVSATTAAELDEASRRFANVIAIIGVVTFMALLAKGAKSGAKRIRAGRLTLPVTEAFVNEALTLRFGSAKNVGTQVRRNVRKVIAFLRDHENATRWNFQYDQKEIAKVLSGIDLHAAAPVEIVELKTGTQLIQRRSQHEIGKAGEVGRWFSDRGVSGRNLGIDMGDKQLGPEHAREYFVFELTADVKVIRSKAAPIKVVFSDGRARESIAPLAYKDQPNVALTDKKGELAAGGGVQYFIPEGPAVVRKVCPPE